MTTRMIWQVEAIQTFATHKKAKDTMNWLANKGCMVSLQGKEIETTTAGEKRWQEKERLESK